MPKFDAQKLKEICHDLFVAAKVPEDEAQMVAESLVTANLMGLDSHGVIRVIQYLDFVERGWIKPGSRLTICREAPAMIVASGNWGFGQVIARQATQLVIERARQYGMAAVTIGECNHIGRVGEFTTMIAEAGMLGFATANGHGAAQRVTPWGGAEPRLSTNPIAFSAPSGANWPIVVDFATSVTAEGKIRVARNAGKRLPEPWIYSAEGELSADPNALYGPPQGAILPFGGRVGYKGYALSVMIDILSGGLSAAGTSRAAATRIGNGVFIQAVDIARFIPLEEFEARMRDFAAHLKSAKLAPGFKEILMPGEPEYRSLVTRLREGIIIDDETWRQVVAKANALGVQL